MKVAFVGKGGSGKSAIAGTFARALARRGEPVLTIDSDPMPGLAFSLGLDRSDTPLPDDSVVERQQGEEGPRFRLRPGLSALDAIEQFAATGPDGVRFLQFGKLRGHSAAIMRSQFAFMQIIDQLPEDLPWSVVGDLPGGTRQPFAGLGRLRRDLHRGDRAHRQVDAGGPAAGPVGGPPRRPEEDRGGSQQGPGGRRRRAGGAPHRAAGDRLDPL